MVMTMKEREKSLKETTTKILRKTRQVMLLLCVCVGGGG